ncbi:hypothetical protein RDI58_000519 [Solanum bulbocastanum]|uniref:Uncharacterized protein n=1 Tax=Solanum bulbocastanum TaxID=147425 RepID=A0AAN8UB47_SOLBU
MHLVDAKRNNEKNVHMKMEGKTITGVYRSN